MNKKRLLTAVIAVILITNMNCFKEVRVNAMGIFDVVIGEKINESNPKQYEMNVILSDLFIKDWIWPSDASDEIDGDIDEPLGQYSEEELRKYTDIDYYVDIEYMYGYVGNSKRPFLMQIIKIYENGDLISISSTSWENGYVQQTEFRQANTNT